MRTSLRRLSSAAAISGLVLTGAAVTAAPAQADAAACLSRLMPGFDSGGNQVIPRHESLIAMTSPLVDRVCSGLSVSMGISRTDLSDFRNQNARQYSYEENAYTFITLFTLRPADTGTWIIRQIAVKDRSGRLAVKNFSSSTYPVTVRRESRLTGRPSGNVVLGSNRTRVFDGYLKAYSTVGTWAPMAPGRTVLVQARPLGYSTYRTIGTAYTSSSGYWRTPATIPAGRNSIRIAFVTPYQTIASDYTWLGEFR